MAEDISQYDLLPKLIPHLDPHLILPMIDYLIEIKAYDVNTLLKQKLALLSKTKMIDVTIEEYNKINGENAEFTAQMLQKKEEIVQQLSTLKESIGAALSQTLTFDVIDSSVANTLCTPKQLLALFEYASLLQDVGRYNDAFKAFSLFVLCALPDHEHYTKAVWARLHCVLLVLPSNAIDVVKTVRDYVDSHNFTTLANGVQNRVWFSTWVLFLTPKVPQVRNILVEFVASHSNPNTGSSDRQDRERFLNAIISSAPHLLRYITVFVVMNARQSAQQGGNNLYLRRSQLKELSKLLSNERANLDDPFVDFILSLYVDFDFKAAIAALHKIVPVIQRDYFLHHEALQVEFFTAAKALLTDTYLKLHTNVTKQSITAALPLQLPFIDNTFSIDETTTLTSPNLTKPPYHRTLTQKMQRNISK